MTNGRDGAVAADDVQFGPGGAVVVQQGPAGHGQDVGDVPAVGGGGHLRDGSELGDVLRREPLRLGGRGRGDQGQGQGELDDAGLSSDHGGGHLGRMAPAVDPEAERVVPSSVGPAGRPCQGGADGVS